MSAAKQFVERETFVTVTGKRDGVDVCLGAYGYNELHWGHGTPFPFKDKKDAEGSVNSHYFYDPKVTDIVYTQTKRRTVTRSHTTKTVL